MSEIDGPRRKRIIAAVLAIGLLVGLAEFVVSELWSDWTIGVFTPISFQIMFLLYGFSSIWYGDWSTVILLLPIGAAAFVISSLMAVAPLLVPKVQRRFWAGLVLILLLASSALGWWHNWPFLQWGPDNIWRRPLAYLSGAMLALCLIAGWFGRRNPDGRAAFWYPAALQVWIQSLWIPWPDDD